ncbi:4-(cytidine 5'-diphospho)-2-C-methyl-D-erythritol kinase [Pyruvatibacter sp. HU-CL02332]|uniref:4-(cytidine 5'-diphospho)-2-C-methyl-D-erythritol kinase n=1 Tax=Pyruvatibacter sp. HU-CL02332 TaxID=3127650 RepID=UPI00310702A0
MTTITEFAPAKINLTLHVLGKRPDGYHLLESLVVFASAGDTLTVDPAEDLSFHVTGPNAAALADTPDADNLVLKAARLLNAGGGRGARITLEKRLPVAAGIGGGSADCAAAMRALNTLWGLGHDAATLGALGLELGADVPVCVQAPSPCVMSGIGEKIARAPSMPDLWCVLVNPGVPVATGPVFKALNAQSTTAENDTFWPGGFSDAKAAARFMTTCRNDLEPPARNLVSEVGETVRAIAATKGCLMARMSGSGATCFGLYADEEAATHAAAALARNEWWVEAAHILS